MVLTYAHMLSRCEFLGNEDRQWVREFIEWYGVFPDKYEADERGVPSWVEDLVENLLADFAVEWTHHSRKMCREQAS